MKLAITRTLRYNLYRTASVDSGLKLLWWLDITRKEILLLRLTEFDKIMINMLHVKLDLHEITKMSNGHVLINLIKSFNRKRQVLNIIKKLDIFTSN